MTRNGPTGPARDTGRTRIDSEARSGEGPKGDKGFNGEVAAGGCHHLLVYRLTIDRDLQRRYHVFEMVFKTGKLLPRFGLHEFWYFVEKPNKRLHMVYIPYATIYDKTLK